MAATTETFQRNRITWIIYGLVGYFAYLQVSLGPVVPFLRREHDLDFTTASLHFSAFAAGALVVGLFADRVASRYGRRFGLWGGGAGMAGGAVAIALGPSSPVTITASFMMGSFGSMLLIMTQSILADQHGRWRTVAITESNVAASGFAMLASLAIGAAASTLSWRAALAPPVITVALLFAFFRSEVLGEARAVSMRKKGRASLPLSFWTYWAVLFMGVAAEWTVAFWGAEFLTAALGLSPPAAATTFSVFFAAMLSGRVLSSWLARRIDDRTLLLSTLCLATVGVLLLWLSRDPVSGLAGLLMTGLGLAGVYPVGLSAGVSTVPSATDTAAARLGVRRGHHQPRDAVRRGTPGGRDRHHRLLRRRRAFTDRGHPPNRVGSTTSCSGQ